MSKRKVIAIGGEPASGKSTLIKSFLKKYNCLIPEEHVKLVPGLYIAIKETFLLGSYDEGEAFPGTDRYSMAVQPAAHAFIDMHRDHHILFEGDRLFNAKFLEYILDDDFYDLEIIYLKTSQNQINFRHKDRNDSQSEKFIKGRQTKYSNILGNFILKPYVEEWKNETIDDLNINTEKLVNRLAK